MMNKRLELNDEKHLKQFIELYKHCKNASRLSKVNNEEQRIFSLKETGLPIKFGCTEKLLDYIPEREGLYNFWQENDYFWIIPMEVKENRVYGFTIRGYEKNYNVFRLTSNLPVIFGLYDFEDFNFNKKKPIILTEGIKDALMLKTIYPYTLSLNTAGLTQNALNFVTALTDRFILIYDNDKPGRDATERDKAALREKECRVFDFTPTFKDCGKYIDHPKQFEILNLSIQQYL